MGSNQTPIKMNTRIIQELIPKLKPINDTHSMIYSGEYLLVAIPGNIEIKYTLFKGGKKIETLTKTL